MSDCETGSKGVCRVEVSKLVLESGSRASMFMVRQLSERVAAECCWMMDILGERCGVWMGRWRCMDVVGEVRLVGRKEVCFLGM